MKLAAHGIHIDLPRGWSGRVFSGQDGVATLHVGNYALALSDGQFGDRSTDGMRPGATFLSLTEYRPGSGLHAGHGLFSAERIPRRFDPSQFSVRGLAHPRPDQVGTQHFFTVAGRPFCLYIVLAGRRTTRRRQLAEVDHVLKSLRIDRRV